MIIAQNIKEPKYRTKIIKAGALLADTRTFFSYWDLAQSSAVNLERMQSGNVFGKGSRSRVQDVLAVFRQRYLTQPGVANALAILVQNNVPASILTPIFYFHTAKNDALLHDVVTEYLAGLQSQGRNELTTDQLVRFLLDQVYAGRTAGSWSDLTLQRLARGLLSTLRDFGVLSGAWQGAKKQIAPTYLPVEAFAYVAFVLNRRLRSGNLLVMSDEWRLFFLSPQLVEHFFVEADLQRLLTYHAAGRIVRVDFPTESIEEYAVALAQRAH